MVGAFLGCHGIHVHAQMSHRGSAAWEDSAAESRGGLRLCATTWYGVGDS